MAVSPDRPTLGSFMSMVCFQHLRLTAEDVAGRAPVVSAGRQRGYDLIKDLGLVGHSVDATVIMDTLAAALGPEGTRLCLVQRITAKPNGGYEVAITEGACTAGQHAREPVCAFTLGVFIGALHAISGVRMQGHETACCACGASACMYQIDPIN